MKTKFNFDDDFPLNKLSKFHLMTIIIRCVLVKMVNFKLSEDGKFQGTTAGSQGSLDKSRLFQNVGICQKCQEGA